ncbi:MAG: beta-ACP synthase [Bacteroidaceae bacterium]|nr:beta-ACP synthase [Bacteroidaceae bacterium]
MADKRINIYIGATSMRTCLGDKAKTLAAMNNSESGLKFAAGFGMHVGQSAVKPIDGYTRFEAMLIEQLDNVLEGSGIALSNKDVLLVISTTKGNIGLLSGNSDDIPEKTFIYTSAQVIANRYNAANNPIVISNACISGVSAFVVAKELLQRGEYRHVVIVGGDALCEFITSGFASFKSISPQPCRPYDAERDGLTLGEAAGAVILTTDAGLAEKPYIRLAGGAVSNDANHISGPSRTGDGLYFAISNAMNEAALTSDDIGFVNTHGTATRYNDEMESKAVAWAKLDDKPTNSLKGYIGHTLGASGVVETIACIEELKQGEIFGTKGYTSTDTPFELKLSANRQPISRKCCVKTASGFGGCNAAIVLDMMEREPAPQEENRTSRLVAEYRLPDSEQPFAEFIRSEFKSFGDSNMKFYKMSDMSKGLYIAVERLLAIEGLEEIEQTRRAIVLANKSASLDADIVHQQILDKHLPEGASPAAFVYTLANVAAGEMCIRHKIQGDNTFFIENEDSGLAEMYARNLIEKNRADAVICGWCEYLKGKWNINIKLFKNN